MILETFLSKFGNNAFTWDVILAILFVLFLIIYLIKNRKNVHLEKIAFPILYAFLYRGEYGIKWMEKLSKKWKEEIKLFGYISIGFGFVGMIGATLLIIYVAYQMVFQPKAASVAPFLPFVDVPVLGYISFSHWIITIFVIVLIHEAAHGIVALAHGLKVKKTGFGIFAIFVPLLPAAFVEPDDKKIAKESDVVQYSIFAAGPMSNFVLMIPLLILILAVINPLESAMTTQDGFTFNTIQNVSLPAYAAGINNGTAFNTVNNKTIEDIDSFYQELYWMKPGQKVSLGYHNKSTNTLAYEYTLTLAENPEDPSRGFLGVTGLRNNILIKESAKAFAGIFSWFKGLLTLMFDITFSLGLINLFPASITDGGRMFSVALDKMSKNKERNKKVVATLALIFLIIIFFALITFFTGNPFALIFG